MSPQTTSIFFRLRLPSLSLLLLLLLLIHEQCHGADAATHHRRRRAAAKPLRFGRSGKFRILQVADMHFANGKSTACLDVPPSQTDTCSDLNTTAFVRRMIRAENPDLIVFTGDNVFGFDSRDAVKSMDMAFEAATESGVPWAAVLGNHDQESTLSREGVMNYISTMPHTLSRVNPSGLGYTIDGFGNYYLEVRGPLGSPFANDSVLNLYFLDSGDYSTVQNVPGYGWIKTSQQHWFEQSLSDLKKVYNRNPEAREKSAPVLAYFHIPLPEFSTINASNVVGVKQEAISSPTVNSGFFTTMIETGDVKGVFVGHDHVNDFCGELRGIHLCYAGGFGYHAYGKVGWPRRARVVDVSLERTMRGNWGAAKLIKTRKRLDDENLSEIDSQVIWHRSSGRRRKPVTNGN